MTKLAIISTIAVDHKADELAQLAMLIAEIKRLSGADSNIQLIDLSSNSNSWSSPVTIDVDPFTYNFRDYYVFRLTNQSEKVWYFSPRDISYLALVAMAAQRNVWLFSENNNENMWLLNKHVAVSRTIDRVDHGSRRIYAQTVISDLIGNDEAISELLNGRTLNSIAAQSQAVFEQLLIERNNQQCGCIPQHHLFYMVLEDRVLGKQTDNYSEARYFEEFKSRLMTRDNQRLDSINARWNEFWDKSGL